LRKTASLCTSTRTRSVSCQVELDVGEEAQPVWSVAVAHGPELASESLSITVDDQPVEAKEIGVADGGRLHVCTAPVGRLTLSYSAEVTGTAAPATVDPSTPSTADRAGMPSPTSSGRRLCRRTTSPASSPSPDAAAARLPAAE
jgi:hypothetical protein